MSLNLILFCCTKCITCQIVFLLIFSQSDWLEQERARRLQEWTEFTQTQAQSKRLHADREFEVRAEDLRKHYADLEEKLNQGPVGRVL